MELATVNNANVPQIFSFDNQTVRTVEKDGEPWFVAADVCAVLAIANPTMAMNRLDDDERTLTTIEGASNGLPVNVVNESGLYSLIMTSRKPEAKRFKKWVTSEVLPAIRKTGSYQAALPKTFAEALQLAADQARQIEYQVKAIEEMQPKADFFDAVTGSNTAVDMSIVAKTLNMGIGRNLMFERLRNEGILDKRNIPYQKYCDAGYFRVVESQYNKPDGTAYVSFKTVVFQKGMDYIRRLLSKRETQIAA